MKFKYGDPVRIKKGFYEGLTGNVTEWDSEREMYLFQTLKGRFNLIMTHIREDNLEKA